ncbi:MAG: sulfatase [Candidatus Brocadiia bacterium]
MNPNVIVVLCDQLRRDALSIYGDPNIETPNLDRMAGEGVRFDNACSTYPVCVPFRFTLMTGKYAHTRMIPAIEWRMSPAERTLADEFNEAGYETMYVGKWHLSGGQNHMPGYGARREGVRPVPPHLQGRWKHWRGFELRNSPFDTYYFVDDDPTPRKLEGYQTDGLFDLGMDLITDKHREGQPFACVISVEPPHPPFEAPKELEEKWLGIDIDLPPNFLNEERPQMDPDSSSRGSLDRDKIIRQRQLYYAMVENLDHNMGRLQNYLAEEGLQRNTIVLFASDHGEMLGAHSLRAKQYPFEESCGIPLIGAGPGLEPGRVVRDPVATEDLFPTILGLCGLQPGHEVSGTDLSPLMRGERHNLDRPGVMLEFVSEIRPPAPLHQWCYRGFRSERYKYTVAGDLTGFQPWQFFDLREDPYEMNNLVDDPASQDKITCHHRWLYDRMVETRDDAPLAAAHRCPELNIEPQSIGSAD